jgi:mannose-1-phosphate guanylyltransferase
VSPARTLLVLTRHHEPFYAPAIGDLPPSRVVLQPQSRGTAPAILYAALRLAARAPGDAVAVFPSDHHVGDDHRFMAHVGAAFEAVTARPQTVVLLGIAPSRAEAQYGWIEPGPPLGVADVAGLEVRAVRQFWEKPTPWLAERLSAGGCLWNSFVMVARLAALLALFRQITPALLDALAPAVGTFGIDREAAAVRDRYRDLPDVDFSRQVLAAAPERLGVLPVRGVTWDDLGDPERVRTAWAAIRRAPQPLGERPVPSVA